MAVVFGFRAMHEESTNSLNASDTVLEDELELGLEQLELNPHLFLWIQPWSNETLRSWAWQRANKPGNPAMIEDW